MPKTSRLPSSPGIGSRFIRPRLMEIRISSCVNISIPAPAPPCFTWPSTWVEIMDTIPTGPAVSSRPSPLVTRFFSARRIAPPALVHILHASPIPPKNPAGFVSVRRYPPMYTPICIFPASSFHTGVTSVCTVSPFRRMVIRSGPSSSFQPEMVFSSVSMVPSIMFFPLISSTSSPAFIPASWAGPEAMTS